MGKKHILVLTEYYLPGFKGGGPIRSITALTDLLADGCDFSVLTADRDLGDLDPYPGSLLDNTRAQRREAICCYPASVSGLSGVFAALRQTNADVVYVNGLFSLRFNVLPLLLALVSKSLRNRIVVAPRGQLDAGALTIKPLRKRVFLNFLKLLGLPRKVVWHATSEREADVIRHHLPIPANRIHVAENPVMPVPLEKSTYARENQEEAIRCVFLSRISPKKNLHFLLAALRHYSGPILLDIYGPIEDATYWQRCERIIEGLPNAASVTYRGALEWEAVHSTLAAYDVLVLPTLGENFGHVILESLAVGTAVILSEHTPWQPTSNGAITVGDTDDPKQWAGQMEDWALNMRAIGREPLREAALDTFNKLIDLEMLESRYMTLFACPDSVR